MAFGRKKSKTSTRGIDRVMGHLSQLDPQSVAHVAEKLSAERTLLEKIVQSLQEAVIVVDRLGGIELINTAAERMLGLQDFDVRPAQRPSLWRAAPELAGLLQVGADGGLQLSAPLTHPLQLHYPAQREARLYAAPIGSSTLIVLTDTTESAAHSSRQVEEARLNSVTQLAAGVAHELGNPLNALQIHLQLLQRGLIKDKKHTNKKLQASLASSLAEVARLDQIIRHFLQALRPVRPHLQPTDLVALLEDALVFLSPELQGAGLRVKIHVSGLPPTVMADAQQVRQAYFNVIKNAREACPSGGELSIEVSADDEALTLKFADSGEGMKEEDLLHLFEPYHTTKPGGTGLGMMIVQKIMRAHGGSVSASSRPGQGTVVTLSFPRQYRRWRALRGCTAPTLPRPTASRPPPPR